MPGQFSVSTRVATSTAATATADGIKRLGRFGFGVWSCTNSSTASGSIHSRTATAADLRSVWKCNKFLGRYIFISFFSGICEDVILAGGGGGFSANFDQFSASTTAPAAAPPSAAAAAPPSVAAAALGDVLEPVRIGQLSSQPDEAQKKRLGGDLSSGLNQAIEGFLFICIRISFTSFTSADLNLSRTTTGVAPK